MVVTVKRAGLGEDTLETTRIIRLFDFPCRGSGETQAATFHFLHVVQEGPRSSHGGAFLALT